MQTTKDPLADLVDDIERRITEARDLAHTARAHGLSNNEMVGGAIEHALVELRDAHDRRMREAADVEKPSPVVRSGDWVAELGAAHTHVEELLNTCGTERHEATRALLRCAELDLHVALREERRRSATEKVERLEPRSRFLDPSTKTMDTKCPHGVDEYRVCTYCDDLDPQSGASDAGSSSMQRVVLRPTVDRTNDVQIAKWWVDAWDLAYRARADHWGKMPEQKYRRMIKARDRGDIAWKREREAVERTKAQNVPVSDSFGSRA